MDSSVIPRKTFCFPNEGEGGPDLTTISGKRLTILSSGRTARDNWKATSLDECPFEGESWTGKCIFHETWDDATNSVEQECLTWLLNQVERKSDLPNGLVFNEINEYSLTDDLSGEALDGHLVTLAKREEITEVYRRLVWSEVPVADCFRDTGKAPIPTRWVSTNKGDKLHPNVRCRLVAKHLAAIYGGKASTEDLFAAMPPFELVKALLVKSVQRRGRKKIIRKVLFIDVSKAHL